MPLLILAIIVNGKLEILNKYFVMLNLIQHLLFPSLMRFRNKFGMTFLQFPISNFQLKLGDYRYEDQRAIYY